jgi:NADPH:quinone reductase-like Zn-dependent oxidoreductase
LKAATPGGHVHLIGVLSGRGAGVDPTPVLAKSIYLNGVYVGSRAMFEALNAAVVANRLQPVIDRTFPFDEARAAFDHMQRGSHFGKIVLSLG